MLSLLYAIWGLPETIFFRNFSIVLGFLVALPLIFFEFRSKFSFRQLLPALLIILLFIWEVIYYIWIGKNGELQKAELLSIWKRAGLLAIFGFSFGFSLKKDYKRINTIFTILIVGISLPIFIYFINSCTPFINNFCPSHF